MEEMSLYLQATLKRVWYARGQRPTLLVSPQRDCLHWYGTLALHSGQEVALTLPTMDTDATLHFLNHLLSVFPSQPILLFLDRAPWHRGQAMRDFLADHPRVQLIYFPPACHSLIHKNMSGKLPATRSVTTIPICLSAPCAMTAPTFSTRPFLTFIGSKNSPL